MQVLNALNVNLELLRPECDGPTTPYDTPEKSTPDQAWCDLEDAGGLANTLLTVGLIPGLGTFILTFIFAAKEIGKAGSSSPEE